MFVIWLPTLWAPNRRVKYWDGDWARYWPIGLCFTIKSCVCLVKSFLCASHWSRKFSHLECNWFCEPWRLLTINRWLSMQPIAAIVNGFKQDSLFTALTTILGAVIVPFSNDIILFPQGLLFELYHIAHNSPDTCHLTSFMSAHTLAMDSNLDPLNEKFQPVLIQKKSLKVQ